MRIGIDIRSLQNESRDRGIGTYTRCLIEHLLAIDRHNEYFFFVFRNQGLPQICHIYPRARENTVGVTWRRKRFMWISGQCLFPYAVKRYKLDIFYSPEYIVPVVARVKKVITVHDFINSDYSLYRSRCGRIRKGYFFLRNSTLRFADRIIAVSEYTKQKIIKITGVTADKIRVIYEGAAPVFAPLSDKVGIREIIRRRYGIHEDFFLYVGAIDYHKNIDGLLKAFARIKKQGVAFVIAGTPVDPRYASRIYAESELLAKNKHKVYFLGFVCQQELVDLYNTAIGFISVSVYEGFGLPALEAMACGTPLIAAGNTSMREIVDSGGILVDPYNIDEITYAMENLLSDGNLRNLLSQKALIRAREFSWEKAARETLSLYEDLIG